MFVKCYTSTLVGIEAVTVAVEVNISAGLGMSLVGLPDNAVKESQERIRSAFENSGYRMTGKRLVVNLAPADLRKEGSGYDLPIAIGILAASDQLPLDRLEGYVIMGELSLDGSMMGVKGALPIAIEAKAKGFRGVVLPAQNAREASVVGGLEIVGVENLREAVDFLAGRISIDEIKIGQSEEAAAEYSPYGEDFSDVRGQVHVKRALEIAAAGGHNVIMIGSPGSGKTMLARRMPSIMPPLSMDEALETTKIHSVAGKLGAENGLLTRRPFRAPHHLSSAVAMVGGGSSPQPGEISLAHNGVLFLDEVAEFPRALLEVLRQPLEDKKITVSRAKYTVEYPANFTLVASMNPCPCGFYNHPTKECMCTPAMINKYMGRLSGPLMDRIDMHIEVVPVAFSEMSSDTCEEASSSVRKRVVAAREVQRRRFDGLAGVHTNAMMNSKMIREYCPLTPECSAMLERAMGKLALSARAYDRILKLSRTIADLADSSEITPTHIAEAINYRSLDRENWGTLRRG